MDYRATVNLPKTDFPMRANLPKREPEIQARWQEMGIYARVQEKNRGRPKFVLHDGPPYANGDIHMGHVLNKVLKDIIVRSRSQMGYDAPFVPGFDTHGMPIEHAVITHKKADPRSVGIVPFRDLCREWAEEFIARQTRQFQRLGVRGDWERPYVTFDPKYEAAQIRVFGEMAKKGYIYRGLKVIYWSPSAETALADAEIEYRDKVSPSIYVAFDVVDGKGKLSPGDQVVIWTTTPWTLPANLAVTLHPEYRYSLLETDRGNLLVATELVPAFREITGVSVVRELGSWRGRELEGVTLHHSFYERVVPVVLGEHVTLDMGTGAVHTAPGHGEDDAYVGERYGLPLLSPVDEKGRFTAEAPGFEGMFYADADERIIEILAERGALIHRGTIRHAYPHDWRTKKPVIYRATEQWFASIDGFREELLRAVESVRWIPEWGEIRLANMIRDRGDWCISRQRVWGVPIPAVYCTTCGKPIIDAQILDRVALIFEAEGSNAWHERPVEDFLPEGFRCPHCGGAHFRKETDTMDVWFDSGSSHAAVLRTRPELEWPADLYLEGSDQFRGWFNSSLTTAVAVFGRPPYKTVLGHGFVLDGEGRKMSKSLGNIVDPMDVMKTYGADILRLWVASVDYTADVRISDAILGQIAEVYRKVRNTFRFLLGNTGDFDPTRDRVPPERLWELDRFMLSRLHELIGRVWRAYEAYDFHEVYTLLHTYATVDLSAFYLDVLKDRLYTSHPEDEGRRSAQTVLYETLRALAILFHPILPHTAEEVWQHMPGPKEESVQLADFPEPDPRLIDRALHARWAKILAVREASNKAIEEARKADLLGAALEAHLHLYPENAEAADFLRSLPRPEEIFLTSAVTVHDPGEAPPTDAVPFPGGWASVSRAQGQKCARCWMITPEVGSDPEYPDLCPRCAAVVRRLVLEGRVAQSDA